MLQKHIIPAFLHKTKCSFIYTQLHNITYSCERNATVGMFKCTQIMYYNTLGSAYTCAYTCLCDFKQINSFTNFIKWLICLKINLRARTHKSKIQQVSINTLIVFTIFFPPTDSEYMAVTALLHF